MSYLAEQLIATTQNFQQSLESVRAPDEGEPYIGLPAYELEDCRNFYGREDDLDRLMRKIGKEPLTILHAVSGAGKSSLLQAGVQLRCLCDGNIPLYVTLNNRSNVVKELKNMLLGGLDSAKSRHHSQTLHDFLLDVIAVTNGATQFVIMLDQFEVLFTHQTRIGVYSDKLLHLRDQLEPCLVDKRINLHVRWVIALREEHLSNLVALLDESIEKQHTTKCKLFNLDEEQAIDAITHPAIKRDIIYSENLPQMIVRDRDVDDKELLPSQLQLVCSELYRQLPDGHGAVTLAMYAELGQAQGILRNHLDRILRDPATVDPTLRAKGLLLLEQLVTADKRRRARTVQQLERTLGLRGVSADEIRTLLRVFMSYRIVRTDKREEGLVYDLTHDYLTDQIALTQEAAAQRLAEDILENEVWHISQGFGDTIPEDKLAAIRPYETHLDISDQTRALIDRSWATVHQKREEAIALERRGKRWFQRFSLLLALVATVLGGVALYPYALSLLAGRENAKVFYDSATIAIGTNDVDATKSEKPEREFKHAPFYINQFEVSNYQYGLCIRARQCTLPIDAAMFPDKDDEDYEITLDYPVGGVQATQAETFCAWVGGRLPTELEWVRAARGMSGWASPWDPVDFDSEKANLNSGSPTGVEGYSSSGNPEGVLNLVGNVWEWTATYAQAESYHSYNPDDVWHGDALDLQLDVGLTLRGGGWNDNSFVRVTRRVFAVGTEARVYWGFRCAFDS